MKRCMICYLGPGGMDMIKSIRIFVILCFLFALPSATLLGQSNVSGAIQGKITDETGVPLPGVAVSISSPSLMGSRTTVSDREGLYRFPALPGGTYSVEASLEGFNPVKRTDVVLHVGMTASIDIVLSAAKLAKEVIVTGEAPLVDVTDSAMGKTYMTKDALQNIPTAQNLAQIFTLAPGVISSDFGAAAFGGSITSNSFSVDGIEIGDSWMGGGEYTAPMDYYAVEEVQVSSQGAPAEYGNFTGVATNILTKSGANKLSGDLLFLYKGKSWQGNNADPNDPFWSLLPASPEKWSVDPSVHLGGPIIKDKLWFFGGFEYIAENSILAAQTSRHRFPKITAKLSFQPNPKDRFTLLTNYHYNQEFDTELNRLVAPEAQPDFLRRVTLANLSFMHTFSPNTVLEIKVAGHTLGMEWPPSSRNANLAGHTDVVTGEAYINSYWWSKYSTNRLEATASFSHAVENLAGSHDLKFGLDFERGGDSGGYKLNGGVWYQDYLRQPFMAISFEVKESAVNWRYTAYAQDSWKITDSFVLNPGLRFGIIRGSVPDLGQTVYTPAPLVEPRIGFVWDIFKDHKTVLKGHFGRYYEGPKAWYYANMTPQPDTVLYFVGPNWSSLTEFLRIPGANLYSIDPDIKHPSMDQLVIGLEKVLGKDLIGNVSFIHKRFKNMIDPVNVGGIYAPISYTDPASGQTMTVYNELNPGEDHYYITNPEVGKDIGAAFPGIVITTPGRQYDALEISVTKRLFKNWQLFASYVYSRERGNTPTYGYPGMDTNYQDPNNNINNWGQLRFSCPHVFKLQGTYIFPLDISLSAFWVLQSGQTWTRRLLVPLDQGVVYPMVEPQGSQRLPGMNNLDLRVEKSFYAGTMRWSLNLDIFNLFNTASGMLPIETLGPNLGRPTVINGPRSFRAGLRFWF
jgi:hypothetical protein